MKLYYPALVFCPENPEDGYAVEVPDLPGCCSGAYTQDEALLMGSEAAMGWIRGEWAEGNSVPPPSPLESIAPEKPFCYKKMLTLDFDAYEKKYGKRDCKSVSQQA